MTNVVRVSAGLSGRVGASPNSVEVYAGLTNAIPAQGNLGCSIGLGVSVSSAAQAVTALTLATLITFSISGEVAANTTIASSVPITTDYSATVSAVTYVGSSSDITFGESFSLSAAVNLNSSGSLSFTTSAELVVGLQSSMSLNLSVDCWAKLLSFVDYFNRPDQLITDSSNWTSADGGTASALVVLNNEVAVEGTSQAELLLCPDIGTQNHTSRLTSLTSADTMHIAVRASSDGTYVGALRYTSGWAIIEAPSTLLGLVPGGVDAEVVSLGIDSSNVISLYADNVLLSNSFSSTLNEYETRQGFAIQATAGVNPLGILDNFASIFDEPSKYLAADITVTLTTQVNVVQSIASTVLLPITTNYTLAGTYNLNAALAINISGEYNATGTSYIASTSLMTVSSVMAPAFVASIASSIPIVMSAVYVLDSISVAPLVSSYSINLTTTNAIRHLYPAESSSSISVSNTSELKATSRVNSTIDITISDYFTVKYMHYMTEEITLQLSVSSSLFPLQSVMYGTVYVFESLYGEVNMYDTLYGKVTIS